MKHKKFMDIERLNTNFVEGFRTGDEIYIEEKIDGANAAIRYDSKTDTVICQSRKKILDEENNLRGFYEWGQTLDKGKIKEILGDNLVLFGEWLVPHSVVYPEDKYNHMYFYDCYDVIEEKYLPQDEVIKIVSELGLTYVPIFYHGDFVSWEHCAGFVGKTELGGEYGEGVVIKNISRLNDPNSRLPFYTKIVGDKFIETKGQKHNKPLNPEALAQKEVQMSLATTIVTKARVEKILHKFVDENILPEDWNSKDMPTVAKHLTKAIYEDCLKEEKATVDNIPDFGKIANGICMRLAREILNAKCSPAS